MQLSNLHKNIVFIEKPDGSREGPYKAGMGHDSASIHMDGIDINEGETLIRELPNKEERYLIISAHFSHGLRTIGPNWSLKLQKETAIRIPPAVTKHTTVNIQQSTGIQVGDNNTLTLQSAVGQLIQRIDSADGTQEEKNEAKSKLSEFLAHPLVTSLLGATAAGLIAILKP